MMRRTWYGYGILFFLIVLFDRITKLEALHFYMQRCTINPFLAFEVALNRGISWSMFHSEQTWVFIFVSLVIVAITGMIGIYTYARWLNYQPIIGEILVLAGSISNIIDRVRYGGVVDFIIFSYGDWVFPAFNIADVSIVLGVCIMLMEHHRES